MESGRRKLLALSILLGGLGVAWLVRPSADGAWFAPGWGGGKLILRKEGPPTGWPTSSPSSVPLLPSPSAGPSSLSGRSADALSKHSSAAGTGGMALGVPPALPPKFPFPQAETPFSEPSGTGPPHRHRIVDGDTLENLAERYLGSAVLAIEIYQANRSLIRDPHLLPIGVEITIPPRGSATVIPFSRVQAGQLSHLQEVCSSHPASGATAPSGNP